MISHNLLDAPAQIFWSHEVSSWQSVACHLSQTECRLSAAIKGGLIQPDITDVDIAIDDAMIVPSTVQAPPFHNALQACRILEQMWGFEARIAMDSMRHCMP